VCQLFVLASEMSRHVFVNPGSHTKLLRLRQQVEAFIVLRGAAEMPIDRARLCDELRHALVCDEDEWEVDLLDDFGGPEGEPLPLPAEWLRADDAQALLD